MLSLVSFSLRCKVCGHSLLTGKISGGSAATAHDILIDKVDLRCPQCLTLLTDAEDDLTRELARLSTDEKNKLHKRGH